MGETMNFTLLAPFLAQVEANSARDTIDQIARTPLSDVLKVVVVMTVLRLLLGPVIAKTPIHKRLAGYKLARFGNEALDALIYAGVFVFMLIRPFGVQAFVIPSGSMWPTLYVNDYIVANKAIYRFSDPQAGDIVVFRPPAIAVSPENIGPDGQSKVDYIKRCIGVPGDVIELKEGVLYRNGKKIDEAYRTYSECVEPSRSNCESFRTLPESTVAQMTKGNFKLVKRGDEVIPFNWTEFDANIASPMRRNWADSAPYVVASKYQLEPDQAEPLKNAPAQPVPKGYYLMFGDNRNGSFDGRAWGLVPRESIIGKSEAIWIPLSRWRVTR
jgi:signal peptidase I